MKSSSVWCLVLVIGALLVAACGPQMATSQPGEEASSTPASLSATEAPPATQESPSEGAVSGSEYDVVDPDDWHVQGAAEAPVTIVEFSDFQCPYCARYYNETYSQIKEQYVDTGQVRYIFRHFPLQFHGQAGPAAQAAECAGEQGKFWEMHDALFENQAEWSGNDAAAAVFVDLAEGLDLDGAEFEACLNSDKYAAKIQADLQEGAAEGVTGTPAFFVNGVALSGAQPLAAFQEQIDYFLAGGQPPTLEIAADSYRSMGEADAPVVITMFSDYQCPACTQVETLVMPQLIERYVDTGQVRLVFREFPLPSLHPNAEKAAEAAVCAGEQDNYWEMHDKLFASQDAWTGETDPSAALKELGGEIGLDERAFAQCLDSGDAAAVVQAEVLAGEMMGVNATPYFFVGDLPIRGGLAVDAFGEIIEYVAAGGETPQILPAGEAPTMIGNRETASAVTVAFVDYGNPESAQHALEVLPKLREAYIDTGQLIYVLHPWYSEAGSPAEQAAIAADCAGQQGSYWEMHDRLFEDQQEWLTAADPALQMEDYASALNLDVGAFDTCLGSDQTALHVMAGKVVAALYGVPGAPVFLFNNGQGQQGSPSFEEFQSIIDSIVIPQG
jgi:protein-disulfide isomerase